MSSVEPAVFAAVSSQSDFLKVKHEVLLASEVKADSRTCAPSLALLAPTGSHVLHLREWNTVVLAINVYFSPPF